MASPSKELVARIRGLLDRLVDCRRQENMHQKVVVGEVMAEARSFPRDGATDALNAAIGISKKRREEAVIIVSELMDSVDALELIGMWLNDPDQKRRSRLIQIIGHHQLKQFASLLNAVIQNDPDFFCRGVAIHTVGVMKAEVNLPILLNLAQQNNELLVWRLAFALTCYATEECRPHLQRWLDDRDLKASTRVASAWGLGKLGDKKAIEYLIQMLDDPNQVESATIAHGESLRAAQALCDIHGWPFEWTKSYVAETARRVLESGLHLELSVQNSTLN